VTRRRFRAREAGFGVIESLVACLVVAAMLGAMYETVIAQARAARMVHDRRLSLLVAQSALESVAGPDVGAVTAAHGLQGDIAWSAETTPYAGGARDGDATLERVTVRAGPVGQSPLVTLSTLRLSR